MATVDVYDGIVDNRIVSRDDHPVYTTIQAADDALDGGPYHVLVKEGTYAGFTVSTDAVRIFVEPCAIVTSTITLSGDHIGLILGPGVDVQADIQSTGIGNYILWMNGGDSEGVVISGARSYMSGGGWGSLMDGGITRDGVDIIADDIIVENISAQTTAGGASSEQGIRTTGERDIIASCRIPNSDGNGVIFGGASSDGLVLGTIVLGADADTLTIDGPRTRAIGNYLANAGVEGIAIGGIGDNSVCGGHVVQDPGSDSVELAVGGDNCVVCGNRLDGAINDGAAGTVAAINDTTGF